MFGLAARAALQLGPSLARAGLEGAPVEVACALTSTGDRDPFVGTPWHKHVPARLERL